MTLEQKTIPYLTVQFAQAGTVELITTRASRGAIPHEKDAVVAIAGKGLEGDHYKGSNGKRSVTIIQQEHIEAVASMLGKTSIDPKLLRRNIVVSGINLLALKGKTFRLGSALLEYTGACHPCSRMEENLGKGGYNAMRGHGGITCRILESGTIKMHDTLTVVDQ